MRRIIGVGVLVGALLVTGCGDGLKTSEGASEVGLCDELITAGLIGDLSQDPVVAAHQLDRAEMGLETDLGFVTSLADPTVEAEREVWPVPLHPDELPSVEPGGHHHAVVDFKGIVDAYGDAHPDTFSGVRIMRAPELYLEAGFTGDLDAHREALAALAGTNVKVLVVEAPHSRSSLQAAAAQIADALAVRHDPRYTVSNEPIVRVAPGRYLIRIGVTDWPGANVAHAVGAVPRDARDMVCIRHTEIPRA